MKDPFENIIYPTNPRNEIVIGMPDTEYRSADGLSPSALKKAVEDLGGFGEPKGSAARLRSYLAGEIENKRSKSLGLGTLAHRLILESDKFIVINDERRKEMEASRLERKRDQLFSDYSARKFMCNFAEAKAFKADNNRTPDESEQKVLIKSRIERELAADSGLNKNSKEMLDLSETALVLDDIYTDHKTVIGMKDALDFAPMNYEARELLADIDQKEKRVEVSIFCVVDITVAPGVTIPVQMKGRPDLVLKGDTLHDYKTCRSIHIEDFSKESIKRGYFFSMAIYLEMLRQLATKVPKDLCELYSLPDKRKAVLLAQETTAPFEAYPYEIPNAHLVAGWHCADMALKDVCKRYLADRKGEKDAWKTCIDPVLLDPLFPASISYMIQELAGTEPKGGADE
jgi:hypothetical protein